jgi:hypothetical protein
VAAVVALEKRLSLFHVWREKYSWTLSTYLAGMPLVILIDMLRVTHGVRTLYFTLPFCVFIYHFYKTYYSRTIGQIRKT